jgi:putative copper resistance protein D
VAQLLSLFGFLAVLFRGAILALQSLAIGGVVFNLFVVTGRDKASGLDAYRASRRLLFGAALLLALTEVSSILTSAAILVGTANISFVEATGANFFLFGAVAAVAALTLAAIIAFSKSSLPAASLLPAAVVLAASIATSHAAARLEQRELLIFFTVLHQAATAAWIGGLPYLFLATAKTPILKVGSGTPLVPTFVSRFSRMAQISVAALLVGGAGLSWAYAGSISGLYGTSYGLMIIAKAMLFALVLLVGGLNFFVVKQVSQGEYKLVRRLRRFSEVEIGIGFTAILAAASLTSQAPAFDVAQADRATRSEIVTRVTPQIPSLKTPPLNSLTPPSIVNFQDTDRPQSFAPGTSYSPPTPGDIAWSEYNHNWSGLLVAAMGILAVLARSGRAPWARHWPLAFVGLAVFLLLRADPENWPLGPNGFFESFSAADVTQHRIFVLLILIFAAFEWGVQNNKFKSKVPALVFPAVCALGGAVLLTHSHAVGNLKEETLIELTHIPLAIFAVIAGWTRWMEIRLPDFQRSLTSRIWPVCFVLIGMALLFYREH